MVRLLARGQRARGSRVLVAAVVDPAQSDVPFVTALSADGTPTEVLRVPGRGYLRERRVMVALCAREQPSIVHTHGYRPDIIDSSAARSLGVATVTTVHGFTGGGLRNRVNEWLQVKNMRRFAAVVAVSRHLADRLARLGVPQGRIHTIANGFDTGRRLLARDAARRQLGLEPADFAIGWVGRLSHEKGADVLIEAVAKARYERMRVVLMGDGPERQALEARCATLGLVDVVRFAGIVPDAGSIFPAFDAFVLSSRTEGLPIVLLEAMAARVPIVAARVGGVPEVVSETEAWLTPAEDPGTLALALDHLRADPSAARERAESARRRLDRDFALDAWVQRYDDLYRAVSTAERAR